MAVGARLRLKAETSFKLQGSLRLGNQVADSQGQNTKPARAGGFNKHVEQVLQDVSHLFAVKQYRRGDRTQRNCLEISKPTSRAERRDVAIVLRKFEFASAQKVQLRHEGNSFLLLLELATNGHQDAPALAHLVLK